MKNLYTVILLFFAVANNTLSLGMCSCYKSNEQVQDTSKPVAKSQSKIIASAAQDNSSFSSWLSNRKSPQRSTNGKTNFSFRSTGSAQADRWSDNQNKTVANQAQKLNVQPVNEVISASRKNSDYSCHDSGEDEMVL